MESEENVLNCTKAEVNMNKKALLVIMIVTGCSFILSGLLAYIFSHSIITIVCSLIIGATIGIMINYYVLSSSQIIKNIDIEIPIKSDEIEENKTTMKFE